MAGAGPAAANDYYLRRPRISAPAGGDLDRRDFSKHIRGGRHCVLRRAAEFTVGKLLFRYPDCSDED